MGSPGERRRRVAAGLLAAVLAAACGGGEDDEARGDDAAQEQSERPAEPELLWSVDVRPVSRPVAVGDQVVMYVNEGDRVVLAAYDATTGSELWRRPSATPGKRPLTDGERVFHLVPVDDDPFHGEHLEAVDGATGETVWQSEQAGVANHPLAFCTDAASHICVQMTSWPVASTGIWVVATADGAVDPNGFQRLGNYSGAADDDLALPWVLQIRRSDGSASLYHVDRGTPVWQRPMSEIGDPDVIGLVQWFGYDEALVGVTRAELGSRVDDGTEILEPFETIGLDAQSGERLWSAPFDADCGGLNRLDLDPLTRPTTGWGSLTRPEHLVLCALTGQIDREAGEAVAYDDVGLTVAELDPRSGDVVSSVEVADAAALAGSDRPLVRLGPATVASVHDDGTPFVLDLETGELGEPDAGDAGWCFSDNDYEDAREAADRVTVQAGVDRGADFTTPCGVDGEPRPAPTAPDPGVGATVGDVFVWMDAGGVHAVDHR